MVSDSASNRSLYHANSIQDEVPDAPIKLAHLHEMGRCYPTLVAKRTCSSIKKAV